MARERGQNKNKRLVRLHLRHGHSHGPPASLIERGPHVLGAVGESAAGPGAGGAVLASPPAAARTGKDDGLLLRKGRWQQPAGTRQQNETWSAIAHARHFSPHDRGERRRSHADATLLRSEEVWLTPPPGCSIAAGLRRGRARHRAGGSTTPHRLGATV